MKDASEIFRAAVRDTVRRYSIWYLIQGAILIAAGVLAIVYSAVASVAVITVLGWLLVISGAAQAISLVGASQVPHFWLQLISVVLAILIGLMFLNDATQGLLTVTLLLIVFFMMEGISKVVFALTIRPFPNWAWVLAAGVLGMALSLVLWVNLPISAIWLIGLLLGVQLIGVGASLVYLAWSARNLASAP
ncbi:HdeD family acid-resistance protein [Verticiella sediminum]|uniref:HdeD family acid-resistance protein n=1 Tax=Verticiella sediminum TaxID=1247510 RepID=UPI001B8844DD|nr:HdeD family acid-resistance protein [Verticiella sediminum]